MVPDNDDNKTSESYDRNEDDSTFQLPDPSKPDTTTNSYEGPDTKEGPREERDE